MSILNHLSLFLDGKQLAMAHDCKFIETSSGIQHNVDELLVGVLKQIRLREEADKKKRKKKLMGGGSRTSLSLGIARDILQKMCLQDNRSKSCENLLVLWAHYKDLSFLKKKGIATNIYELPMSLRALCIFIKMLIFTLSFSSFFL